MRTLVDIECIIGEVFDKFWKQILHYCEILVIWVGIDRQTGIRTKRKKEIKSMKFGEFSK